MDGQPKLFIHTLGRVQVFLGTQLLTEWVYRDAPELFYFLLLNTRKPKRKPGAGPLPLQVEDLQGKSKEQIGLELWPDVSPKQLDGNIKSRLLKVRRVLGHSDWILEDNSQYKFNATWDYWFDVEQFEAQVAAAKHYQSQSPEKAIACLQDAIQLYQGDFLADLPLRRAHKIARFDDELDGGGREWLIRQQEALRSLYQQALHQLGGLLLQAQDFEQAAEAYRLAAAKDEYDDDAHYGLMLCLGSQKKISQALAHYRRLLKQRADTPPSRKIVALAERLQRGEEFAPRPPAPEVAQRPAAEAEPAAAAPFQAPTDLPRFVGRAAEFEAFRAALTGAAAMPGAAARPYCLAGMGGIGKTSLAVHLAHSLRDQFPDGVLWAHLSTSEPLAILDSWARSYQCDFSGLPDLDSRAAALRAVLADKQVLMILDDVWDAARARALLVGGRAATVLMTSRDLDLAQALDAQIVAMPVFAAGESQQLLARILGQPRVLAEAAAADEICALLGHLPLALDIAAHRLASRPRWTLREMAERIRLQQQRLAELKLGDREVRASFAISWDVLSKQLRATFAALGVFQGRALSPAALAAVAGLAEPATRDDLDALVALSLLSFENSIHYRQHPLLADFAREKLAAAETQAAEARMTQYFLRYATEHRQNYLALEDEWDNLAASIQVASQQQMWQELIDYGDVLTNAWFARGRFTYARQAYPLVCAAARQLEEQDAYIAGMINWGRACIEQSDYAEAQERLQDALQTSREVNDLHGIASAKFHLGRVAHEQADHDNARKLLAESQTRYEQIGDQAGIGNVLLQRARIEYRYYDYVEVERLGKLALEALRLTNEYEQIIDVLRFLALAMAHQGQHALADQYCREALQVCEDGQCAAELPSVLYTRMQLAFPRGDYNLAIQSGEKCIALFRLTGQRKSQSAALEYLARIYAELKDYAQAEESSRQSLALSLDLKDDWGSVYALRGMGKLLMLTERPADAHTVFKEALVKAQALKHPLEEEIQNLWVQTGQAR